MDNLKPSYSIHDDRFDVAELADKELILEFQRTKFVFIVKCLKSKEIQWLEEYPIQFDFSILKQLFSSHAFLKANYWAKVKVVYHPIHKAIVPKSYFNKFSPQELLPELLSTEEEPNFDNFKITSNSYLVYQIDSSLSEFLEDTYPKKKIDIVSMDLCLVKIPNCYAMHFEKENLTLQIIKDGSVLQSRILHFDKLQQFKIIIESLELGIHEELVLTGEITTYSKYYHWLNDTFEHISFGKPLGNIRLSQYFSEVPKHKYITVLNGTKNI